MGNPFSMLRGFFEKKEAKILMLGLDAAGKTTILYQFKLGIQVETIPTMGFAFETIQHKNFKMNVWDVAGQANLRTLWKHYFQNTKGLIFVVDSSDKERMSLAKEELHKIVIDDELKDVAVLLLANKMDLNVCSVNEVETLMDFEKVKNIKKKCVGVCAIKNEGLPDALDWLANNI